MDIKCFVQGCKKTPSLCCYCTSEAVALCHNHMPNHIQKYPNLIHSFKSISKILTQDIKEKISKSLSSKLEMLKSESKSFDISVLNILTKVQMIAKDFYTKNKIMKNICKKLLKEINENNSASVLFRKSQNDTDQVRFEDVENEVFRRFKLTNPENENSFYKLSYKLTKECAQIESYLNNSIFLESNISTNFNEYLYVFQEKTKNLVKFSTESLKKSIDVIQVIPNQGSYATVCYLPFNKLFVSGGFIPDNTYLSTSFLIDLTTNLVDNLQEVRRRAAANCIYRDNKICIFGGCNGGSDLNICDAFDLKSKKWEQFALLPKKACHTSILDLNNKCLIAGRYNFIYTYDWNSNSYCEVTNQVTIDGQNILIRDNKKIHLLCDKTVNLGNINNIKVWQKNFHTESPHNITTCLPIIKGRFAYFADDLCTIYQYDLDSYEIKIIA
ncbi:hypothetical protein SteCoe_30722 [Stentor coeruleus]|uniref:Uncharacterized protein n=1 Tax=Stentor coeruleus TaxID=5963 RepID=A0A1R2B308_9CILI|nr:hypothetical protein SteCoe_30722 [Stentor coeruleus]